jgi:DNA-binding transcriptional ArsR family regulator
MSIAVAVAPEQMPPRRIDEAAALLSAMASPRRLAILCRLVEGEAGAAELAQITGLSSAGVASHLAQLRRFGVIAARRQGVAVLFSLASEEAEAVLQTLHGLYCAQPPGLSRAARAP